MNLPVFLAIACSAILGTMFACVLWLAFWKKSPHERRTPEQCQLAQQVEVLVTYRRAEQAYRLAFGYSPEEGVPMPPPPVARPAAPCADGPHPFRRHRRIKL